jgi:hypothetical protein
MANTYLDIVNPDSSSISNKGEIDITVSLFDISASGHFGEINTNYTETEIVTYIPAPDYLTSSSYYTPIYSEKINYETWINRINRNFQELD